jgi:DNA-directed RNA polymerase subunit RPC12/RpoP
MTQHNCMSCGRAISSAETACPYCGAKTTLFRKRQRQLDGVKKKETAQRTKAVAMSAICLVLALCALFLLTKQFHSTYHLALKVTASGLLAAAAYGVAHYFRLPLCLKCGHRGQPKFKHLDLDGKPDKRFKVNALICSGCNAPAADNLI